LALYRFENELWKELETTYQKSDDNYAYYSAKSPGFSYYVIAEKTDEQSNEEPKQQDKEEQPENQEQSKEQPKEQQKKQQQQNKTKTQSAANQPKKDESCGNSNMAFIVIGLIVLVLGGIAYLLFLGKEN